MLISSDHIPSSKHTHHLTSCLPSTTCTAADTDTVAAKPFDTWVANNGTVAPGLVVGIEDLFRSQEEADDATYVRQMQMIQWTMAAKRGHPITCRMGGMIKQFMEQEKQLPKPVTEVGGCGDGVCVAVGVVLQLCSWR